MLPTVRVCTNHVISTDRVDDDYNSNLLSAFTKLQKTTQLRHVRLSIRVKLPLDGF